LQEKEVGDFICDMKGPCPSAQALVAFVEETLPPEDRRRIDDHLVLCGSCSCEVRILRQAESADDLRHVPPSRAERNRMRRRFDRVLRGKSAAGSRPPELPGRMAFVMAAAILVLLYPAYIGFKQLIPGVAPVTGSIDVIHLEPAVRGAVGAAPEETPAPRGEWTGLMFWVPARNSPNVFYDCRILSGTATVFSARRIESFDGFGNFLVVIRASDLKPDAAYELVVNETGAERGEWRFPFRIGKERR